LKYGHSNKIIGVQNLDIFEVLIEVVPVVEVAVVVE
jgi:hypothetical protein